MMGSGVLAMTLIPNPMWGRMLFVLCSAAILTIGIGLRRSARAWNDHASKNTDRTPYRIDGILND